MEKEKKNSKMARYKYLTEQDSQALKEYLAPNWHLHVLELIKRDKKVPVPAKSTLHAIINGRVKGFRYMAYIKAVVDENKKIMASIRELSLPQNTRV